MKGNGFEFIRALFRKEERERPAIFISIRITNPKNEAVLHLTQHSIFIRTTLAKQFCRAGEEYLCRKDTTARSIKSHCATFEKLV